MGEWDAVIDVSNVCWSAHLPPQGRRAPLWRRLELVMAAWREAHGGDARFELVADESLWRTLNDVDVREFRRLHRSGALATRPVADDLVLELARDRGLHVITRDHYIDHRNEHPWIEREPERFHCWTTERGRVRMVPLGITPCSGQSISQARENKDLKWTAKLDAANPRDRRILGTRWKCANLLCVENAHWQDQLLVWPTVTRAGAVLCPSCQDPLLDLGPRDPLFEVVVEDLASRGEIMRFPLEVDCPVTVGRGSRLKGVNLAAGDTSYRAAVKQVSRRHLLLRMDVQGTSRRLMAVDLGARNGTEVERWAGASFHPPKALTSGKEVVLGFKDRLVLGEAVTVRLSGKHYVNDVRMPETPDSPGVEGEVTIIGDHSDTG